MINFYKATLILFEMKESMFNKVRKRWSIQEKLVLPNINYMKVAIK